MVTENTKLNVERARDALNKAKPSALTAIRSPRPVDLRQLEAEQRQQAKIDHLADGFRNTLRQKLGVNTFHGDYAPMMTPSVRRLMDNPMCDADVCMPQSHSSLAPKPAPAPQLRTPGEDNAIALNEVLQTGIALRESGDQDAEIEAEIEVAVECDTAEDADTAQDDEQPVSAIDTSDETQAVEAEIAEDSTLETPAPEAPKKRKKFLGIF